MPLMKQKFIQKNVMILKGKMKMDKKKPSIKNDRSTILRVKIKKRPWENYQKCTAQTYQCYCSELKKLNEKEKNRLKSNRTGLSNGKPLPYQDGIQLTENFLPEQFLKTFQVKSKFRFSLTGRNILTSFTNKYIYYAIDDILYLLDSNPIERDNLLSILYSCMLSLHNDFSVNFFDIWIDSIYINENYQTNRFLKTKMVNLNQVRETTITLKLHYFTRAPIKKPESIW